MRRGDGNPTATYRPDKFVQCNHAIQQTDRSTTRSIANAALYCASRCRSKRGLNAWEGRSVDTQRVSIWQARPWLNSRTPQLYPLEFFSARSSSGLAAFTASSPSFSSTPSRSRALPLVSAIFGNLCHLINSSQAVSAAWVLHGC